MKLEKVKVKSFLTDLLYPNRCPCCNSFIKWNELICETCMDKLKIINNELCQNCGKKKCMCDSGISFDRVYACYSYENAVKGIVSLKKGNNINFGVHLGNALSKIIMANEDVSNINYVVPVPMSAKKKKLRGYNQAEIIAASICRNTGIELNRKLLNKEHTDVEQHTLNAEERKENVKGFNTIRSDLHDKIIILCDDVLTTGNTLNRCSYLLKDSGAEKIIIAVGATVIKSKNIGQENNYGKYGYRD